MFRRRIPFSQVALATVLGVAGGIYVYKPLFEPQNGNPSSSVHHEDMKQDVKSEAEADGIVKSTS